ncbi:hypothetical protein D0Z08_14605 [Nocardioides immobilis]|uniref:Uncharacterized protein n=1 Tax=Nocardioides immobilis TaxID=2049295 RepID=A0A417Y0V9_9ACTN|nr:hypothetical protein D0Z08_14605 [Nocardioides immobilis]
MCHEIDDRIDDEMASGGFIMVGVNAHQREEEEVPGPSSSTPC